MQALPSLSWHSLPPAGNPGEYERHLESLREVAAQDESLRDFLTSFMAKEQGQASLAALFGNSPYLSRLLLKYPEALRDFVMLGANATRDALFADIQSNASTFSDGKQAMPLLRHGKGKLALLAALADITGCWNLTEVTGALSDFAELALRITLAALIAGATARKELAENTTGANCGVAILGMGKLGSHELNYSSDIDLIILFDPMLLPYTGKHTPQHFATRLAQDLVTIMQERTAEGYVFRTDLRLRPDPRSTPPAVTIGAAIAYYESVGQNWERAAMIKARVVGGDARTGQGFLDAIRPFIWRKHLDFAAIEDILSIKRQMHSKTRQEILIPGHNIKTGRGGIREIEFLGQIYQLIWGGRMPELRIRGALATLAVLENAELITRETHDILAECYGFLRTVEHRLQMIRDEQTQTLPEMPEEFLRLALFLGYPDAQTFSHAMLGALGSVHRIYNAAFARATPLGEDEGALVFTGVEADPSTLRTLTRMGYREPEKISATVRDWHKGYRRCTRTKRSRELLTELMPHLLKALSRTPSPDTAFLRFDAFMERLPSGVQIFSLFSANPHLLGLVADIMGSAPQLGETLSANPHLLYAVLIGNFFGVLPDQDTLERELESLLLQTPDAQDALAVLHTFQSEKQFQAGIQLLRRMITAEQAGAFLSHLADLTLSVVMRLTLTPFELSYGHMPGGSFALLAIGRLGGEELSFGSDIDLMFIYDAPDEVTESDGLKPLSVTLYYNRLAQRILGMITAQGKEGRLYEVDTRLRPFGKDGPLATSLGAFDKYYQESAWVFEKLALTRGRAIWANDGLGARLEQIIRARLSTPMDGDMLREGVRFIRSRTAESHATPHPWDIKYAPGGLLDVDFLLQYYALLHADALKEHLPASPSRLIALLTRHRLVDVLTLKHIRHARKLYITLLFHLRLCGEDGMRDDAMPAELRKLLANATGHESFEALHNDLLRAQQAIAPLIEHL